MNKTTSAIRLARTPEVERVLKVARKRFPTLDDPEIFKLALGYLVSDVGDYDKDMTELNSTASQAVDLDYLSDPEEDIYHLGAGKRVRF